MKKRISLWISNFLLLVLSACGQEHEHFDDLLKDLYQNTVPLIKAAALHEQISRKEPILLIDTREKREYEVSHLPGARYGGYDDFDLGTLKGTSKDTPIVVYCSVGYRSERIGEKLKKAGFTNVQNLYGGIFEWKNKDFPVYRDKQETEEVHAYSEKWGKWLTKGVKVYE